ncbi:MAG TPA: rRNA maturation RNase YbeY [Pyrinomonadaceae bacterium]
MIEAVNRQRKTKIDTEAWQAFAARAVDAIGRGGSSVTIAFVSDKTIRELNRQFRGVAKATDVLSFPSDDPDASNLGDIAISVDTASVQAKENGLTLDEEVAQLILHGLLHLCGYDHETDNGEMNRLEWRMRKKLGI